MRGYFQLSREYARAEPSGQEASRGHCWGVAIDLSPSVGASEWELPTELEVASGLSPSVGAGEWHFQLSWKWRAGTGPGPTPIEVPDEKGEVSTLAFGACSVDQMRRAIQRKRKPSSSKPLPSEALVLAEQYSEAVALRFPRVKGAVVKMTVRNQKGQAVLDFKGIPLDQVSQLAEALTGELPEVSALPKPPVTER